MPDWKTALASTPDISFIDGRTIEDVKSEMVADYEAFMTAAEGKPYTLGRAAPHRMELYAAAAQIYQAMQCIDRGGKVNLLKYSYGGFLDNLALIKGPTRNPAAAASTNLGRVLYGKLSPRTSQAVCAALVILGLVICTGYLVDGTYNPFLYFRF